VKIIRDAEGDAFLVRDGYAEGDDAEQIQNTELASELEAELEALAQLRSTQTEQAQ
jgi:hypothetical protein